jgi:hypothetical protein
MRPGPAALGSTGQTRKEVIQMPKGKNTDAVHAGQLIAGTRKHFANVATLAFGSGAFTPAQIEGALQTFVDARQAVDAAKAVAKARVADENTKTAPLRGLMIAYAAFVKVTFANSPDVLADFGLQPNKATTPLTIEQKATAAARREATRAARHTMGKQQKKNVKGTITTIAAPAPSPAAPSGSAAGAPTTGAGGSATPHGT